MTNASDQFQMPRRPYQTGPRAAAAGLNVHVNLAELPMSLNCRS